MDETTLCHIVRKGFKPTIPLALPNSPSWAKQEGISWDYPKATTTASSEGGTIRLTLRDSSGGTRQIVWNPSTSQVSLVRTDLWSRPFYFYLKDGECIVSDSLRQILRVLPKRPPLNNHALDAYLALEFFPAPLTPFCGIHKVGVEETCLLDLSTQKKEWITEPLPQREASTMDQAVQAVSEALHEAIGRHVGPSETIDRHAGHHPDEAVLLCSGGLDSTILAHFMHGQGSAIVLSYADSWKNEVERARQTAGFAQLPLREIQLPDFSAEEFARYVGLLDEPLGGTCGYATSHLCQAVQPGTRVLGGHGTGAISLMNFKHRDLRDCLHSGTPETLEDRFSAQVTYLDEAARRKLFVYDSDEQAPDPVKEMLEREVPFQEDRTRALYAMIRRQLCVAEETTQLWSIFNAFGHTPVMPFLATPVYTIMDRLPVSILRNDHYERRLLGEIAQRYCPGYTPQPRQLGYGLPLGLSPAAYPNERNMEEVVAAFSQGPLDSKGLKALFDSSRTTDGKERFNWLRRLWSALVLNAWLDLNTRSVYARE